MKQPYLPLISRRLIPMSDLYRTLDRVLVQKIGLYNELIEVMKEERTSISKYSRENLERLWS